MRVKQRRGHSGAGRVRIIGGRLRGSVLSVPDSDGLRPTPARVRETLFNWLQPIIDGAHCLDLFAGSGALGIEAISRGAASARLVEKDAGLATALRDHLVRLGCSDAEVCCSDAFVFLGDSARQVCDVVFIDPPFGADSWVRVAAALEDSNWLAAHAWIYVEMPADLAFVAPDTWTLHRQCQAGDVRGVLYRRHPPIR